MQKKVYVVLSKSEPWPSKRTNGTCVTLVLRDLDTQKSYKVYADTTFSTYNSWNNLKVNDKVTGVKVFDEKKKIITSASLPMVVNKTKIIDIDMEHRPIITHAFPAEEF